MVRNLVRWLRLKVRSIQNRVSEEKVREKRGEERQRKGERGKN